MEGETSKTLRERFGDRKPPDISRKITACVLCRKQKIKCHMQDGRPPCSRCKRRGLSCTVNKSLQMLLESDVDWKAGIVQRLTHLESTMSKMGDATSLDEIRDLVNRAAAPLPAPARGNEVDISPASPPRTGQDERAWEIDVDAAGGPAAIPASHLTERVHSSVRPLMKEKLDEHDVIKRGVVTLDRATELFNIYHDRFDHFLYRILGEDRSFDSVRSSSPLLLSAICAVSALQTASADFEKCYQAFLMACSARVFSTDCASEDVQAYCIGAFWLSSVSWNLVGAAVRAATQLQLHRSVYKALEGDRMSYLRTRLFYLVYVCDHHFSVPYGRLPMTGSHSDVVMAWRSFLKSKHAHEDDARLVSQVQVWRIYSRVQEKFGLNVEAQLPVETFPQVRSFIAELDSYRAEWNESYNHHAHIGNYPNKGLTLHYHFAKLYVCSHIFRGRATIAFGMVSELDEIVNISVISATSILTLLTSDEEIRFYLDGLPSYFFTMITFTSAFLLKLAQRYPDLPCVCSNEIFELIGRVVETLRLVCATMHEKHLLKDIVHGLEKVLAQVPDIHSQLRPPKFYGTSSSTARAEPIPEGDPIWFTDASDISLLQDYDFLSFQNPTSGFDFGMNFEV